MSIQRLIKISAYSNSSLRNDQAMFSNKAASDSVVNVDILHCDLDNDLDRHLKFKLPQYIVYSNDDRFSRYSHFLLD